MKRIIQLQKSDHRKNSPEKVGQENLLTPQEKLYYNTITVNKSNLFSL